MATALHLIPTEVTVVQTAQQLQAAVVTGAPNIELRTHIDLSTIPAVLIPSPTTISSPEPSWVLLGIVPIQVYSIRGNCAEPPSEDLIASLELFGAPLLEFKPGQCLVVVDQRVLDTSRGGETGSSTVVSGFHRLWLDGLYFRYKRSERAPQGYNAGMVSATSFSEVIMTAVTMQGDADGNLDCGACGVRAGGTGFYAEGCTFADFEGDMIIHTNERGTTALKGCEFLDNRGHPLGVLNARSAADGTGALYKVERCTFTNNTGAHLLQAMKWQPQDRLAFYSDTSMHVFHNGSHWNDPDVDDVVDEEGSRSLPIEEYSPDRLTLGSENDFYVKMQQVLPRIPRNLLADAPPVTTVSSNPAHESFTDRLYGTSSGRGNSELVAWLSAAGALLVVALVAAVCCCVLRRKRQLQHSMAHKAGEESTVASSGPSALLISTPSIQSRSQTKLLTQQHPATLLLPPSPSCLPASQSHTDASGRNHSDDESFRKLPEVPRNHLEPSSEASNGTISNSFLNSILPRSLLLQSNTSGDPNVTHTTTTVDTTADGVASNTNGNNPRISSEAFVPAFGHGGLSSRAAGGHADDLAGYCVSPLVAPGPPNTAATAGSDHTTASASWLAGGGRHAWHSGTTITMHAPNALHHTHEPPMHGAPGSAGPGGSSLIHTLDAMQGQHLTVIQGLRGTVEATFDVTSVVTLPAPHQTGAQLTRELLETALDNLSNTRGLFLEQFELLGPMHRRTGGQGVVQFARSTHITEGVAIKFFLNRHAFECEEALYMRAELRSMMPAITMIESNESGVAVTDKGWRFPPFIVVEKGESLDEWQRRIQPDFPTIVQVLSHVAERVHTLHALGVAHRDLKPGNVLWRPLEHSWTLIDFGCAAEIGLTTRLTFSPAFAPPETLCAVQEGAVTTVADTAADVWAMGVIAYELTTKHAPFPVMEWRHEDILAAALGERPYPWESEVGVFRNVPELRILGSVVKGCLSRDAGQRPSAANVLTQLNSLFDSTGS